MWVSLSTIARVRECFTLSSCVSQPEREWPVVWTLMLVMSVIQGSFMVGEKVECVLGQSVLKLLLALPNKTTPLQLVLVIHPRFHGMNLSACTRILASLLCPGGWTSASFPISGFGVDRTAPLTRLSSWFSESFQGSAGASPVSLTTLWIRTRDCA